MNEIPVIILDKRPSIWVTVLRAFLSVKTPYKNGDRVKKAIVAMKDNRLDETDFKDFLNICEIDNSPHVMIQYLYSNVYHYMMQVWLQKEFPLKPFGVLNTRTSMYLKRQISFGENFSIHCHNSDLRPVEKGLEVDMITEITSGEEKIYGSVTTYLLRGNYGSFDPQFQPPLWEKLTTISHEKQWFLKDQNNFRFGKLSGDTNPIHILSWYARMYGFRSKFSQPIRIISKCLELMLEGESDNREYRLAYFLKGPVYYNSMVTIKYKKINSSYDFEIYSEGNDRACIGGWVSLGE